MHPVRIRRMGVRIFPDGRDPQSGASLAQERRVPRSARRRRDRFLDRRADMMGRLIEYNLMPADPAERKALENLDPWRLRAEGLDRALSLHEFGRALFHLNQRRGFKSNRRTDRKEKEKASEAQGMKAGAEELAKRLDSKEPGRRTLGEYLYTHSRKGRTPRGAKDGAIPAMEPVRFRAHIRGSKAEWDLYPTRAMVEAEFEALWSAQAAFHPVLKEEIRAGIRDIIFWQRPLKPVKPGPCTLDPEPDPELRDRRAPLALPIQQEFRILQELANLELRHKRTGEIRRLSRPERDKLLFQLRRREKLAFKEIYKALGIENVWAFNLESGKREGLKGDIVSYRLSRPKAFGEAWYALPAGEQTRIVEFLLAEEDEEKSVQTLASEWGLPRDRAEHVATIPLPDGFGRLGRVALGRIIPVLRDGISKNGGLMHFDEAVQAAGYEHHSDFRIRELFDEAPYYGQVLDRYAVPVSQNSGSPDEAQYGRIANPTVHVGLNQLRQLLNAIIRAYGHPSEIVVELARELKQTLEERKEATERQTENREKNERRKEQLAAAGIAMTADAMLRMRLWEELGENIADRRCVYTGEPIGIRKLFSSEVEIEHILPFALTLDDSPANLTVALTRANRDKGNRIPFEAFGTSPAGYDWDAIALRASALPRIKRWRFQPDAIKLVQDKLLREEARLKGSLPKDVLADIEKTGGFLARQLVDTAYLARVARQYLTSVVPAQQDEDGTLRSNVWVVPGGMTGMLRRLWGINRYLWGNRPEARDEGPDEWRGKLRTDHRHHAVDAFVLTLIDRPLLQAVQTRSGESGHRTIDNMPDPIGWPRFREDLKERFDRIVISYKPEHGPSQSDGHRSGTSGRLHEETAYGLIRDPARERGATLVYRKSFTDLNVNEIERIRDPGLRARALDAIGADGSDRKKLKEALTAFAQAERQPLRHVRLTKVEKGFRTIKDRRTNLPYKAVIPGENHAVDIVELPDGRWIGEGITVFDANQEDFIPEWRRRYPGARLVMRLHKSDVLKFEHNGEEGIFRIVKLQPSETNRNFVLSPHLEAGNLQRRHNDGNDSFRWVFLPFAQMKTRKARKITVDLLGRVRDPGPPRET